MPRYVYVCPDCKYERDITHSIKDEPEIFCPRTGHKMERKLFPHAKHRSWEVQ